MEPIRYSDVLRATGGEPTGPVQGDPLIEGVTTDSREVPANSLFVPLRGPRFDGHAFMQQAFTRGASFSLVRSAPPMPSARSSFRDGKTGSASPTVSSWVAP